MSKKTVDVSRTRSNMVPHDSTVQPGQFVHGCTRNGHVLLLSRLPRPSIPRRRISGIYSRQQALLCFQGFSWMVALVALVVTMSFPNINIFPGCVRFVSRRVRIRSVLKFSSSEVPFCDGYFFMPISLQLADRYVIVVQASRDLCVSRNVPWMPAYSKHVMC